MQDGKVEKIITKLRFKLFQILHQTLNVEKIHNCEGFFKLSKIQHLHDLLISSQPTVENFFRLKS